MVGVDAGAGAEADALCLPAMLSCVRIYCATTTLLRSVCERLECWTPPSPQHFRCGSSQSRFCAYRNHRFVSTMRLRRRRRVSECGQLSWAELMLRASIYSDSRLCGWPNLTPPTKIHSPHPIYYCNQHIHDELLWLFIMILRISWVRRPDTMRCDAMKCDNSNFFISRPFRRRKGTKMKSVPHTGSRVYLRCP